MLKDYRIVSIILLCIYLYFSDIALCSKRTVEILHNNDQGVYLPSIFIKMKKMFFLTDNTF